MTKSEMVTALAVDRGISEKQAKAVLDTILDTMTDALARGEGIELRGFCSFSVKHYKPYEGRNPKTGQSLQVKSKRLPFFKASLELREQLNK